MVQLAGQIARPLESPTAVMARLGRWMPPGVASVMARLREAGGRAVIVGGAVRNALLGLAVPDWDLATDLTPRRVAALFDRVVTAGEKHGTIMVLSESGPVEVTTFRGEGPYIDGRRPSHVYFHGDLDADLARRDFTINAMAVDLAERRLVDPHQGRLDIARRLVRSVGDPGQRFAEDGLRPLRAVRFAGVLDFKVERRTAAAIAAAMPVFARVAWERKRDELERLLGGARRLGPSAQLMRSSGMLAELAPELAGTPGRRLAALDGLLGLPWLRLAGWAALGAVDPQAARTLLERWRVSRRDQEAVRGWLLAMAALPVAGGGPRGADLRRWMAAAGKDEARGAAMLAGRLRGPGYRDLRRRVERQLAAGVCLEVARLAVDGADMLRLGLRGAEVGNALRYLLEAVLERPSLNRRERLLELAHRLSTAQAPR